MHSLIKTALIAAVGAAVVTASPAFAAKAKRGENLRAASSYQGAVYAYAPAYGATSPAPFWSDPGSAQIVLEYLKDAPIHNGNNY
jgi:hypothetical protein